MLRVLGGLGARPAGRLPAPLLLPTRGRKTRHDPPAKSKAGRVATPPAVDPTEFFVLTERYRQYRQTVRALRCVRRRGRRPSSLSGVCVGAGERAGGRRECQFWARLRPGWSSCPRCARSCMRPGPGSRQSARRRRTRLSIAS